jgi:hypothetical protein
MINLFKYFLFNIYQILSYILIFILSFNNGKVLN